MTFALKVVLLTSAVAALGAAGAQAQSREESGGVRLLVGGGTTLPLGDFGEGFNNGPHGLVGLALQPVGFPVGFRIGGMYHRISGDEDVLPLSDLDTQILSGTLDAVLNFSTSSDTPLRPYLLAGGGYYNLKGVGDDAPEGLGSETDLGINAGAGFDYRAGDNLGIFLEARYHLIFTEEEDIAGSTNTNILPISLGVRIGRS